MFLSMGTWEWEIRIAAYLHMLYRIPLCIHCKNGRYQINIRKYYEYILLQVNIKLRLFKIVQPVT